MRAKHAIDIHEVTECEIDEINKHFQMVICWGKIIALNIPDYGTIFGFDVRNFTTCTAGIQWKQNVLRYSIHPSKILCSVFLIECIRYFIMFVANHFEWSWKNVGAKKVQLYDSCTMNSGGPSYWGSGRKSP